jgi:hypothetical protein
VVKLGRGGQSIGVSRPSPAGIRAPPPGSGVVPFSSSGRPSPNQSDIDCSGYFAFARLDPRSDPGPYVSGTMGTGERNNPAYGISCRTRPIPIVSTRSDIPRNRYRMGRFSHRSLQLARDKRHKPIYKERCDRRRARPEKWPDLGPVDCRPGLLPNCEATNLIRPSQPTGSTPQEVGLPRRFTSRLRRSHRGLILRRARMLSMRFFEPSPKFLAQFWHVSV